MTRWLLPDYIQDTLPGEAKKQEALRSCLLDLFRTHGYQLVRPPLLEFLGSLTEGFSPDIALRTFQLVDQISGRTMGVRADITRQAARIDAHLLNHPGVTRLCYCGSVLHTLPLTETGSREPLQLGAELYGHLGIEADIEIVTLLARVIAVAGVTASRVDLSHMGLYRALVERASIEPEDEESLLACLLSKDISGLSEVVATFDEPLRSILLALPDLYGHPTQVLPYAQKVLPDYPEVINALNALKTLTEKCPDVPFSLDLSDLSGYYYHTGIMFAAYVAGAPAALARGGRYDGVGRAFGRNRPATGFSLDLRELVFHTSDKNVPQQPQAILAPWNEEDAALQSTVENLRSEGEEVIMALPGHDGTWTGAGCDRELIKIDGQWRVIRLSEDR